MANYQRYQQALLETARNAVYREFPLQEKTARAFLAYPRHCFIKRTRLDGVWVEIAPENCAANLELLYRDIPLTLMEDEAGNVVSTISQPSFVLYMLDLLKLEEGQTVFELGAGSGWNAALLSFLVGEKGHVYSAEIIPEMAWTAQENMRALKIANVTIIAGDDAAGFLKDVLLDRVIFTAGGYDLPGFLFERVKKGGLMLFPLKMKGGGDILYLLEKANHHFNATKAMDCVFVPVTGKYQLQDMESVIPEQIAGWESLPKQFGAELPFSAWGTRVPGDLSSKIHPLRFFLSISEPAYLSLKSNLYQPGNASFGLRIEDSLAIYQDGRLLSYGNNRARDRFLNVLQQWLDLGMPGPADFYLEIYPAALDIRTRENQWRLRRKESQFLWTVV